MPIKAQNYTSKLLLSAIMLLSILSFFLLTSTNIFHCGISLLITYNVGLEIRI